MQHRAEKHWPIRRPRMYPGIPIFGIRKKTEAILRSRVPIFIKSVVYNVTGKKGLLYDTDFVKDLALNSFDVMNIVCAFEDHFDVDIPNRDVWQLRQVKDVIKYMIDHGITKV